MYVGNIYGSNTWDGRVAEIGTWGYPLSDDELLRVSIYGPLAVPRGLLIYLPCIEKDLNNAKLWTFDSAGIGRVFRGKEYDILASGASQPHPFPAPHHKLRDRGYYRRQFHVGYDLLIGTENIPAPSDWSVFKRAFPSGLEGDWDTLGHPPWSHVSYGGTHFLYYGGADYYDVTYGTPAFRAIGVATSTDRIHWTPSASNPIIEFTPNSPPIDAGELEEGATSVSVWHDGTKFHCWFSGNTMTSPGLVDTGIYYRDSTDGITFSNQATVWAPSNDEVHLQWGYREGSNYYLCYNYREGADPGYDDSLFIMESTSPNSGFSTPGTPIFAGRQYWHSRIVPFDATYMLLIVYGEAGPADTTMKVFYFRRDNPYAIHGPITEMEYDSGNFGKMPVYISAIGAWHSYETIGWYDGIEIRTALVPSLDGFGFYNDDGDKDNATLATTSQDEDHIISPQDEIRFRGQILKPKAGAYELEIGERDTYGTAFVEDSFTEASSDTLLENHTGETGATWQKHHEWDTDGYAGDSATVDYTNDILYGPSGGDSPYKVCYIASGLPASEDVYVEAVFTYRGTGTNLPGICARMGGSAPVYFVYVRWDATSGYWDLREVVDGVDSSLGTWSETFTSGTRTVRLTCEGQNISVSVGGTERITATVDGDNVARGYVGIHFYHATTTFTASQGVQITSIEAYDRPAPSNFLRIY